MSLSTNLALTLQNRKALKKLIDSLTNEQLNQIPIGYNNNIVWNCGHVLAVQQMLTYGLTEHPWIIEKDVFLTFRPGTKPEGQYDDAVVENLKTVIFTSFEQLEQDIAGNKFASINPFMTRLKFEIIDIESAVTFNLYHEALHMGQMLNIIRQL